ncbi:PAT1 [Auxenochlorella protothecoides x Auxenochlorella symbiontica]
MRPPVASLRGVRRALSSPWHPRWQCPRAAFGSLTDDADTVFCTNVSALQGSSPVLLGLLDYFQRQTPHVGFFQPIGANPLNGASRYTGEPKHVALMKHAMGLKDPSESMYGVTEEEAKRLLTLGRFDELMDRIFVKYQAMKKAKDVILLEGATVRGLLGNHNELNAKIAAELDTSILMIMDLNRDNPGTASEIASRALRHRRELQAERASVLGLLLNKVPLAAHADIVSGVAAELADSGLTFAGGIPYDRIIGTARVNEFANALGAKQIYGRPELIDSDVTGIMVAAQSVHGFLDKLEAIRAQREAEGQTFFRPLVLTTKDRQDLVLGLAAASLSGACPPLGGLVLCDGGACAITPPVHAIMARLGPDTLPVLEVPHGAFETARRMARVNPGILPTSVRKVREARALFGRHVDVDAVASGMAVHREPRLTPKRFVWQIEELCRAAPQRIVLPEAHDHRVLSAAAEVAARGIARVTLLGEPGEVAAAAARFNVDVSRCEVEDHRSSTRLDAYADFLVEARKKKALTKAAALDQLTDINMFGTIMVAMGDADGMVSGATCTTANTIRPALQVLKTPDRRLISSVFFMCLPDRVLVYGDCAVNVEPTAAELAQIATTSADTAAAFGVEPRVAMLSYSTLGSGAGPQVDLVTEATALARAARPELAIEGPIQYDAAVDPGVAATKVKGRSEVAGRATVCVFPDLNTGNNTYKAVQQSTGAIAIGPLMQGLARPVNDLSRGCTVADIVNTVACTAVQAAGLKAAAQQATSAAAAA